MIPVPYPAFQAPVKTMIEAVAIQTKLEVDNKHILKQNPNPNINSTLGIVIRSEDDYPYVLM